VPTPTAASSSLDRRLASCVTVRQVRAALPGPLVDLPHGGSGAQCARFTTREGEYVAKSVEHRRGAVDGHGVDAVWAKLAQLRMLGSRLPHVRRLYPRTVRVVECRDGVVVISRFERGTSLSEMVRRGQLPAVRRAIESLLDGCYRTPDVPARPGGHARRHHNRVLRRLPIVARLDRDLVRGTRVINGTPCRSVHELFVALRRHDATARAIDPQWLCPPVHGDLNMENILVRAEADLVLLDPRGTRGAWDPIYDVAKLTASALVFEDGLPNGFDITRGGDGGPGEWCVRPSRRTPAYASFAHEIGCVLGDAAGESRATRRAWGTWDLRLLVAVACHVLAEAPCRISDTKDRTLANGHRGTDAQRNLAIGLFLVGNLLLEKVVRAAENRSACVELMYEGNPLSAAGIDEPGAARRPTSSNRARNPTRRRRCD
jgi:hypothetical protein